MKKTDLLLVAALILLVVAPLFLHRGDAGTEVFGGADGEAMDAARAINPEYEPWFEPLWEPPSGEIESMLFTLQAAIGAGCIGFYFGKRRTSYAPTRPHNR